MYSKLDVRNVKTPPLFKVEAPKNAPNVVIILIDDIGFGGPSTFGAPIQTPTLDGLAAEGISCSVTVRFTMRAGSHGRFIARHGKPSTCRHWRQIHR